MNHFDAFLMGQTHPVTVELAHAVDVPGFVSERHPGATTVGDHHQLPDILQVAADAVGDVAGFGLVTSVAGPPWA